jgi:hypothetical protein
VSILIGALLGALTGWTGTYRLPRGELMRQRMLPCVVAAQAIGVGHAWSLLRHIAPKVSHLLLVRLALLTIAFIKGEASLSFLGFGVPVNSVPWGTMIAESQADLVNGRWWQLVAAGGSWPRPAPRWPSSRWPSPSSPTGCVTRWTQGWSSADRLEAHALRAHLGLDHAPGPDQRGERPRRRGPARQGDPDRLPRALWRTGALAQRSTLGDPLSRSRR